MALVAPLLLIILLGVVELGRFFELKHALSGLTREAANLAARGSSLEQAVTITLSNAADIALDDRGGVVASQITSSAGRVIVKDQQASAGYGGRSRVGLKGAQVNDLAFASLNSGESLYVVEVFCDYATVTPFPVITKAVFPEELYERVVF